MPFFHLAVDITERGWVTVEAPDAKTAYKWGWSRAADVYEDHNACYGRDVEFGGDVEPVPPGDEIHFTVEARLDNTGKEIESKE
jgi:hypothetical protein